MKEAYPPTLLTLSKIHVAVRTTQLTALNSLDLCFLIYHQRYFSSTANHFVMNKCPEVKLMVIYYYSHHLAYRIFIVYS